MKWLVLLLVIGLIVGGYHYHEERLKESKDDAELKGFNEGRADAQAAEAARKEAANAHRPVMSISQVLEPLIASVQAPLNLEEPADIVPVIEITKQRVLDKSSQAEPERKPIFDQATATFDYLNAVAEERTKCLESMLHNRATNTTALSGASMVNSSAFFNQSVTKRWDATLLKARPVVAQLLERLRTSEREWNRQLGPSALPERYEIANLYPVMIPIEQPSPAGVTLKSTPVSRVWRSSYYSNNGYRVTTP